MMFYRFASGHLSLAPFLEESGPVAATVGSPQVAATGAAETAIVPSVIAGSTSTDA